MLSTVHPSLTAASEHGCFITFAKPEENSTPLSSSWCGATYVAIFRRGILPLARCLSWQLSWQQLATVDLQSRG